MKAVLLRAVLSVVALVAIVFGVGLLLPVAHVAAVRAEYSVTAEKLFEVIADYQRHPEWRPSVERVEQLPPHNGRPAWRQIGSTGALPMELTESDPPRRMVTTILSEGMPFGGRWLYELEPIPRGTALTITEEGEVYNPIFRFVSRFIMGHHGTATTYLEDLGRKLGDDVTVQIVR